MTGFKSKREAAQAGSVSKDDALKLALWHEAMAREPNRNQAKREKHEATAKFIKEALAQPEQEPLEYWNAVEGWVKIDEVREHFDSVGCGTIYKAAGEDRVPVYTTPPQREWVGLTWDDVPEADVGNQDFRRGAMWAVDFLKEKNT